MPVRALVTVTADGSPPVLGAPINQPELGRSVGPIVAKSSVSIWALVLVGLGAAGLATFLTGTSILVASRRRAEPVAARVTR